MRNSLNFRVIGEDRDDIREFQLDAGDTSQRDRVLEELGAANDLLDLRLFDLLLDDSDAPMIAKIVTNNPQLKKIDLSYNNFSAKGITQIAESAQTHASLKAVNLTGNKLKGREGGSAAALFALTCPHLTYFDVTQNPLGDEGIAAIDDTLPSPLLLRVFSAYNCAVTETGFNSLYNLVQRMPVATDIYVNQAGLTDSPDAPASKIIFDAVDKSSNKNLCCLTPEGPDFRASFRVNLKRVTQLRMEINNHCAAEMDFETLAACYERRNAIGIAHDMKERMPKFLAEIEALPALPVASQPFSALFKADDTNIAPLDNPMLWDDPAAVMAFIDKSGQVLNAATLHRTTDKGTSLLQSAFEGYHAGEALHELNLRDIRLQEDILLGENGQPTAFFEHVIERGDGALLFTPDNWKGGSLQSMQACLEALPEEQKEHVALFRLTHSLRQEARQNSQNNTMTR